MMEHKPITRQQQKILDAAVRIRTGQPPSEDDITYMARPLVQATLPHSDPGDVPVWTRINGDISLVLRPGWNHDKKQPYGFPYGTIPRLLMFWMVREAVAKGSRRLELGNSLADFMRGIGLDPSTGGGPRSDARRLRDQAERLFQSTISFDQTATYGTKTRHSWLNMQIAPKGMIWWDDRKPEQPVLFGSWIEITEDFFKAITETPIPVNLEALSALKNSSMALDLYTLTTFMAHQSVKSGSERFIPWDQLQKQLGSDYADLDDFRKSVRDTLKKILPVYPELHLGDRQGGLEVLPSSKTSIPHCASRRVCLPPVSPLPAPVEGNTRARPILSRMVIETFRALYPRLNMDACKEAFDIWLDTKEKQPTAYGRAFLGFAKKWAVGKC